MKGRTRTAVRYALTCLLSLGCGAAIPNPDSDDDGLCPSARYEDSMQSRSIDHSELMELDERCHARNKQEPNVTMFPKVSFSSWDAVFAGDFDRDTTNQLHPLSELRANTVMTLMRNDGEGSYFALTKSDGEIVVADLNVPWSKDNCKGPTLELLETSDDAMTIQISEFSPNGCTDSNQSEDERQTCGEACDLASVRTAMLVDATDSLIMVTTAVKTCEGESCEKQTTLTNKASIERGNGYVILEVCGSGPKIGN